ncbi:hypothetical protein HZS_4245, partial [Henneguya salminicola]
MKFIVLILFLQLLFSCSFLTREDDIIQKMKEYSKWGIYFHVAKPSLQKRRRTKLDLKIAPVSVVQPCNIFIYKNTVE